MWNLIGILVWCWFAGVSSASRDNPEESLLIGAMAFVVFVAVPTAFCLFFLGGAI